MGDVNVSGVTNDQILVFNSTTLQWENQNQTAASGSRTYTGLPPITVDNDANLIGWNPGTTTDWNGLFDGLDSNEFGRLDFNNTFTLDNNFSRLQVDNFFGDISGATGYTLDDAYDAGSVIQVDNTDLDFNQNQGTNILFNWNDPAGDEYWNTITMSSTFNATLGRFEPTIDFNVNTSWLNGQVLSFFDPSETTFGTLFFDENFFTLASSGAGDDILIIANNPDSNIHIASGNIPGNYATTFIYGELILTNDPIGGAKKTTSTTMSAGSRSLIIDGNVVMIDGNLDVLQGSMNLAFDLNNNNSGSDANFFRAEADFFFGDGAGLTNLPSMANLLRTYDGLAPITVNNDSNQVGLNVTPTTDWNGTFDGNDSTFYIDWNNSVNRLFSLLDLDDNSSFDGRYLQETDANGLYVRLDPLAGQVISGDFDLNHLAGHTFLGHTFFIGDTNDELVVIQSAENATEHLFSIVDSNGNHLFNVLPNGEVDINHLGVSDGEVALDIFVDARGFADIVALEIDYVTGALVAEKEDEIILIGIDQSAAQGGEVVGIEILPTEGSAKIIGLECGILVNCIEILSGEFVDMNSAFVAGVDRLAEFIDPDLNVAMFVNDDDNVLIGDTQKFEEIEFLLATVASGSGIKMLVEHSTGVGTFEAFVPADTTRGMRETGIIAWDLDLITDDWLVGANNEFLIRITRTANNLNTVPIEQKVQIGIATEYAWDRNGDIFARNITGADFNGNGTDINFLQVQAGFFFGDGEGLTNLPSAPISGIFEGGNIDVNSNTGDVLVSFDDGNFLSFAHTIRNNWTFADANQLQFNGAGTFIRESSSGTMEINSNTEINFDSQTINLDASVGLELDGANLISDWLIQTDSTFFFRDLQIFFLSSADGQFDIEADAEIELTAVLVDITASALIRGDLNNFIGKSNLFDLNIGNGFIETNGTEYAIDADLNLNAISAGCASGQFLGGDGVCTAAGGDVNGTDINPQFVTTGDLNAFNLTLDGNVTADSNVLVLWGEDGNFGLCVNCLGDGNTYFGQIGHRLP